MGHIFFDLTVIICLAAVLSAIFKTLKQPTILAYIATGVIIGYLGFLNLEARETLVGLGQIGITLLLFILGLELKFNELKSVGKTAFLAGVSQLILTSALFFLVGRVLGFSQTTSLYLALALALSSTIIVVKLLSDKKDLRSLYGKISIGILLVQDFAAVFFLIFLSTATNGNSITITSILLVVLKAFVIFGWVILLSQAVLPKIINKLARSQEVLFICSLAFAFGIAALVSSEYIGFSIEIGGLLAGLALANTAESYQIISRVRSLRDFFITIFFVALGAEILLTNAANVIVPAVILSVLVLIVKPLIIVGIVEFLGYKKRTAFLTGISLSQISEFSLIMIFMGTRIGHVESDAVSIITLVGAITFTFSSYSNIHANLIYKRISKYIDIFKRKSVEENIIKTTLENHIVIIGANRMGNSLIEGMKGQDDVVVVDFDPDIIDKLKVQGITSFFGDISDEEIQELVNIKKARLVISTVPDIEDNLNLLKGLSRNTKVKTIIEAYDKLDADQLYKAGADYVVLPHLIGGHHLAKIILDENHIEIIEKYKERDLTLLS